MIVWSVILSDFRTVIKVREKAKSYRLFNLKSAEGLIQRAL